MAVFGNCLLPTKSNLRCTLLLAVQRLHSPPFLHLPSRGPRERIISSRRLFWLFAVSLYELHDFKLEYYHAYP
jgi:hypothetical protein